jgi:hypothetical protein
MTEFVKYRLDEVADLSLGKMLDAKKNSKLVRSSPGCSLPPRTPRISSAWISRIRRTDTGSSASRAKPWFMART